MLETPLFDQRLYDQVVLRNGIVVTLISDQTLTRSSCALAVDVGAADDPVELPGLAHFTEHMLFLGTEKYPKENHYKDFLNTHGGSSNASTSMEATVYRFDVNSIDFSTALDIFSQFFKQPLFSPDSTSREIKAVDAEDSKNHQLDGRRSLQILKALMNPSHPYSKFSTGNIQTLVGGNVDEKGLVVREAMKSFYHRYYTSRKMGLALAGPQSLSEMENFAKEYFSDIVHCLTNSKSSVSDFTNPMLPSSLGQMIYIHPVRDISEMNIIWVLPSVRENYRSDPSRLFSFLLGHEGKGSLFAFLQNKGLVTALSAGNRTSFQDFSLFQVTVSLTPDGLAQRLEIVKTIYSFVNILHNMSDNEIHRYWEEMRICDEVSFRYQMKGSTREKVATVAEHTLRCQPEHVLSYHHIHDEFVDPSLVRSFLALLIPGTEIGMISSKTFDWISPIDIPHSCDPESFPSKDAAFGIAANQREPWYGVHFYQEKIADTLHGIQENTDLFLPPTNSFIPRYLLESNYINRENSLDISTNGIYSNPPTCLQPPTSNNSTCWWSEDLLFSQPRSALYGLIGNHLDKIWSPSYEENHLNVLAERLINQITASKRYPATIAGLHQSVSWIHSGIQIRCNGYSRHLPILFSEILDDITQFDPRVYSTMFENVKEKYVRALRSWTRDRPDEICLNLVAFLLEDHRSLPDVKARFAETITSESIHQHLLRYLSNVTSFTFYCHGDMSKAETLTSYDTLSKKIDELRCDVELPLAGDTGIEIFFRRPHTLIPQSDITFLFPSFNPTDVNSALVCHIQTGATFRTVKSDAVRIMIHHLMKEPFFTTLRTKQQLGYVVSLSNDSYGRGVQDLGGLTMRILSKQFHPLTIKKSVEDFLISQQEIFRNLSQEQIDQHIQSLHSIIKDPPTSYLSESARIWSKLLEDLPQDYSLQVISSIFSLLIKFSNLQMNGFSIVRPEGLSL